MNEYDFRNYRVYCDICGLPYRSTETRKNWRGQRVCDADWEEKSPQENLKIQSDIQVQKNMRPRGVTFTAVDTTQLMRKALGRE